MKLFVWRVFHDSIPTLFNLGHRGVKVNKFCPQCKESIETPFHALFGCQAVVLVWQSCALRDEVESCSPGPMDLVLLHIFPKLKSSDLEIICMLLWLIWYDRNQVVHGGTMLTTTLLEVAGSLLFHSSNQLERVEACSDPSSERPDHWKVPRHGELKLNVDASVLPSHDYTGVGGVIRDSTERC